MYMNERVFMRDAQVKLLVLSIIVLTGALIISSCGTRQETSFRHEVPGGDPERGVAALQEYGCISCHTIPGVPRANALVAPPLSYWADRRYIAGKFANTPENLIPWIMSPQDMDTGTAMPDVGVTEADARDMAAYLYTLQRDG